MLDPSEMPLKLSRLGLTSNCHEAAHRLSHNQQPTREPEKTMQIAKW
jgi:hypothetical protein